MVKALARIETPLLERRRHTAIPQKQKHETRGSGPRRSRPRPLAPIACARCSRVGRRDGSFPRPSAPRVRRGLRRSGLGCALPGAELLIVGGVQRTSSMLGSASSGLANICTDGPTKRCSWASFAFPSPCLAVPRREQFLARNLPFGCSRLKTVPFSSLPIFLHRRP